MAEYRHQVQTQTGDARGAKSDASRTHGQRFAEAIKAGRRRKGWPQDDLIEESGVSRATILRREAGEVSRSEPEEVRAMFVALDLDPREAPVLLGYPIREELGLPPSPPRMFARFVEEVIAILEDPTVPDAQKQEWVEFLRFRTGRTTQPARRRPAG